jgi:hypothetical protein
MDVMAEPFSLRNAVATQLTQTWQTHSPQLRRFAERQSWYVASLCAGMDILQMVLSILWQDSRSGIFMSRWTQVRSKHVLTHLLSAM